MGKVGKVGIGPMTVELYPLKGSLLILVEFFHNLHRRGLQLHHLFNFFSNNFRSNKLDLMRFTNPKMETNFHVFDGTCLLLCGNPCDVTPHFCCIENWKILRLYTVYLPGLCGASTRAESVNLQKDMRMLWFRVSCIETTKRSFPLEYILWCVKLNSIMKVNSLRSQPQLRLFSSSCQYMDLIHMIFK